MILNKRGQLDLSEINWMGIIFAVVGGLVGVIVTARMSGGILIKILGFAICAVACYFIGSKIANG